MSSSLTLNTGSRICEPATFPALLLGRVLELACRPLLAFAACLLAGFLIYAPALGGELIWDDRYLVRENPFFRSPVFLLEVFRHYLFFDSFSTYYRPLQNWSYIFDYWLWRGDPVGYHLTNILLHSFSGFLLFLLARRTFAELLPGDVKGGGSGGFSTGAAWLTALLWIVHPVHNAAVAYISGRADSLASVFALSAWLMSFRAFEAKASWRRSLWATGAGTAMLASLCSKEIALVWLILFLFLLAIDRQRRSGPARLALFATLGGVLGIYALLHSLPGYRAPMEGGPSSLLEERPLLMLRALGDYTSLMFWPGRLYMERSISDPEIYRSGAAWISHIRYEYLSVAGLLAMCAAIGLCGKRWPGRRLRIFGAGWFAFAFLPISNLFPLNAEVAEHWIYLASIGVLIFLGGCAAAVPARWRAACAAAALASVAALGARTWVRAGDWVNAETFCARTIAEGGATPRILNTLASVYGQRGEFKKQENILRKMIERFPEFAPARINLGICLSKQGRVAEAEPLLSVGNAESGEVSRRYARTWPVALNLAGLRRKANRPDEALAILEKAQTRFPEIWELVKYDSEIRRETQSPAAAIPAVERFAAAHWWHLDSWMMLGGLRFAGGEPDSAIAAFRHASALDIYDGKPLSGIAEIELKRGRPEAALDAELDAMERSPGEPRSYVVLAAVLEKLGRKSEANGAMRRAQQLADEARRAGAAAGWVKGELP
jgi:tetratricopeptide (TPR) repeat protein